MFDYTQVSLKGLTIHLEGLTFNGEEYEAVGLFKSENKEQFLKIYQTGNSFNLDSDKGININKVDKGCLILNKDSEDGFTILSIDNNRGGEASYWKDRFLGLKSKDDPFSRTKNFMKLCNDFVEEVLTEENKVAKKDQLQVKSKAVEY